MMVKDIEQLRKITKSLSILQKRSKYLNFGLFFLTLGALEIERSSLNVNTN